MRENPTKLETEEKIARLMLEIWAAYREYNPEGKRLSMSLIFDENRRTRLGLGRLACGANNTYWDEDKGAPIDMYEFID